MSTDYDQLVYKYFIAFNAKGIPSQKGYVTGISHDEDDCSLQVKLTAIDSDRDIFDDFDQQIFLPAKESDNWNMYFDYFSFMESIDEYTYYRIRKKTFIYERCRQENINWKVWETTKLLEDN